MLLKQLRLYRSPCIYCLNIFIYIKTFNYNLYPCNIMLSLFLFFTIYLLCKPCSSCMHAPLTSHAFFYFSFFYVTLLGGVEERCLRKISKRYYCDEYIEENIESLCNVIEHIWATFVCCERCVESGRILLTSVKIPKN